MSAPRKIRRFAGRLRSRDPRAPRLVVQQPANDRERPPAIFLIGCQRSGTSLLRRIVDSHPQIACPPETSFILPLVQILHERRSIRGLDGMGYGPEEVRDALAGFVASFFEGYAAAQGKPRWADKTPHYVDCLDDLWALFGPRGRFVLIVRDGMDVAYSLADPKRRYPAIRQTVEEAGGDVPVGAARFWAQQTQKILDFERAHPEACHRISYEDLTADPAATLAPVFPFVGEAWDPTVLDFASVEHHTGLEDPDVAHTKRIEQNSGKHRAWGPDVQARVRAACEPVRSALGYA